MGGGGGECDGERVEEGDERREESEEEEEKEGGVAMAMRCEKKRKKAEIILISCGLEVSDSALIERRVQGHLCYTGMLPVRFCSHLSKLCH